jgi:hypothetical protein
MRVRLRVVRLKGCQTGTRDLVTNLPEVRVHASPPKLTSHIRKRDMHLPTELACQPRPITARSRRVALAQERPRENRKGFHKWESCLKELLPHKRMKKKMSSALRPNLTILKVLSTLRANEFMGPLIQDWFGSPEVLTAKHRQRGAEMNWANAARSQRVPPPDATPAKVARRSPAWAVPQSK